MFIGSREVDMLHKIMPWYFWLLILMLISGFQNGKLHVFVHGWIAIQKKCRTLHILFSLNVAIISVFSAEEECMVINVIGQQLKEWIERRFLPLIFQSRPDDSVNNNAFSVIYCPLQQLGCQIQGDWIMDRHWRLNVGKMCPCAAAEPRSNSLAGVTVP